MESSVCTLIALDLHTMNLITGDLDQSQLTSYASGPSLYGVDWLLAYEGGRRQWLNGNPLAFIQQDDLFKSLTPAGVAFYDDGARNQSHFLC